MPREKIVSDVWRLWNTNTMQTETYFDDSLTTKHKMFCNLQVLLNVTQKHVNDSIIASSGDIPEAGVVTNLFFPVGQEKSSQKINKRLK